MVPVGPGGTLDMEAIANQPQIQHLRQLLRQNPTLVQPILQDIAAQNPQLAQVFQQNPEIIAQLLGLNLEEVGDAEGAPEEHAIQVTPEEAAAIQRVSIDHAFIGMFVADTLVLVAGSWLPSAPRHRGILCLRQG